MSKKKNIFLLFIIIFGVYCSIFAGEAWDEGDVISRGRITLNYLFSLGNIDEKVMLREYYSTIYWSINYFITEIFHPKYQIQVSHVVNFSVSMAAVFGAGKVSKELFNKNVGYLVFIILFFYPIFFGHMSINNKDNILAFSHIWMVYLILRYLKNQNFIDKANKYIVSLGIIAAIATGIQLVFLGSLIPILLFTFMEIYYFKKIINKNFIKKKFFYDLVKCFLVFYFLLVLFWIDAHTNIFMVPFEIITNMLTGNFWTGWPYNLINGNYYFSNNVPKDYLLINLLYKSPEYILILYVFFLIIILKDIKFFKLNFNFFYYKLFFIITMVGYPSIILLLLPFPLYDGMRLFLWFLPYFCIIPALTIHYLTKNISKKKSKFSLIFLSLFIFYFVYNFIIITPYHYTYLNYLNGKNENRYKKFENDYWGTTLIELVKKTNFKSGKNITMSTCGTSLAHVKKHFKNNGVFKIKYMSSEKAEFIIMTNRITNSTGLINCFDKYKGEDVYKVERNGLLLSVIRKIN